LCVSALKFPSSLSCRELVIAPGLLHAKLADEEMGLEKNDEVKQMSPKELDSFIYNTYRMYQTLKILQKCK